MPLLTGHRQHEYQSCEDLDCARFPCRVHQEGYRRGWDDGFAAGQASGYASGYSDGVADAAASCSCGG